VRRSAPGGGVPASLAQGTPVCGSLGATATDCSDSGLTAGASYRYAVFAVDVAGNVSAAGAAPQVDVPAAKDTTPPKAPTAIKDKVTKTKVTLSWKNPKNDLARIVVIWNATRKPRSASDGKQLYKGMGTSVTIKLTTLPAGKKVRVGVFALDASGNASPAASTTVTVPNAGPLSVAPGGKLSGSPTLSWKTIPNTLYYNVQVYEGNGTSNRVAVAWPFGTQWQIPASALVKGKTYTWYVWPGLGAKSAAKYGPLIGRQTFTYTG
jgi:chitodextrinase